MKLYLSTFNGDSPSCTRKIVAMLRGGDDVELQTIYPDGADRMYADVLKALQDDDHLIVEANQRSRRTVLVYSSVYCALTFKIEVMLNHGART